MNKLRLLIGLLAMAVLVLLAPVSHAQATNCQSAGSTINCQVIALGSSGIFSSAALAAVTGDPTRGNGPLCNNGNPGTRVWTGTAAGRDPRKTLVGGNGIPDESGTIFVAWDNDTTPTIICVYLSVDSIVGQRLFYGQGSGASGPKNNGTLILHDNTSSTPACTTAGANKVVFVWDTATGGIPSAVYNALEGTTGTTCPPAVLPVNFTTASTDVRPEDALFIGNQRVLASDGNSSAAFPADNKSALGYGASTCASLGSAVLSSYSNTSSQSVCYTFVAGQPDPISGTAIPATTITGEGALAQIPIVNVTNTASGGFGDLYTNRSFNNVLSRDIDAGYAFSPYGTASLTRDLYTGPNAGAIPVAVVHYLAREPQSGTYTTFEWQVIRNKESALGGGGLSQETNICGPSQLAPGCAYNTPSNNAAACPTAQIPASGEATLFPPTLSCSNYASWGVNGFDALKSRVIGNGEMVAISNTNCQPISSTCNIEDTFGYAFWSLGTFGGKSNIRYLRLDGTDALYADWTSTGGGNNGTFPSTDPNQNKSGHPTGLTAPPNGCAGYFNGDGGVTIQNFSCSTTNPYPYPTFANIADGGYRAWTVNTVEWFTPASGPLLPNWTTLNASAFWLSAADQTAQVPTAKLPDFFPFAYCASASVCPNNAAPTLTYPMGAFRSHYALPTWGIGNANNGITGLGFGGTENGGAVAGDTIGLQAEADSVNFFGASFLAWIQ